MQRLATSRTVHRAAAVVVAVLLVAAVVLQRDTIVDALAHLGTLSWTVLAVLAVLAVVERVSRAEVIRSLLPGVSLARAEVIGDVGAAASKGLPAGGPVATVLRWQIARERHVGAVAFLTMMIASGVATSFVSWGFPLVATLVDLRGRRANPADLAIVGVCVAVLVGAAGFWTVVLRSRRAHRWVIARSRTVCGRLAGAVPVLADRDPEEVVEELGASLRRIARRPLPLLARTLLAQGTGAVVLWVALQGVGVGPELGASEFARVFFVAHVLGSLAPTPGGVGVMEAGLTGALVAAGVDPAAALAGVLVHRFVTYVVPIVVGTVLYVGWRRTRARSGLRVQPGSPASVPASVPAGVPAGVTEPAPV